MTHRGRVRPANEDTIAVAGFLSAVPEGEPVRLTVSSTRPVTCLVADGLGGHADGARASRLAAQVIVDASPTFADSAAIVAAVHRADADLYADTDLHAGSGQPPSPGAMGTTVVLLTVSGENATCVNVGDSRCYLLRDGLLVQLSQDDSPPPSVPGPAVRTGRVTQTLGGRLTRVPIHPHVQRLATVAGDRFLLCSDGLTDYLPLDDVETCLTGGGRPDDVVRDLLRRTLDAGGGDNVSALLVTILE
ncbi:PP2C family serine/threonine-protein phosphatase [Micromonospora sp. Llam0]|uniref:PP2C family protein-serine/threonine phosphatase n=1 Tax=Micromonospora sp. Llam0 TaxID=2485143 RepID=UPI0013150ED5|nr:protein phosphatase 2C domain-containing protein [Micromonospora sp. Llam0]